MPDLTFDTIPGYRPEYNQVLLKLLCPNSVGEVQVRVNYLHWKVGKTQPACGGAQDPETVAVYQPSTPASTHQHQYIFLVYRQPAGYTLDIITPHTYARLDLTGYTSKGGITLIGGIFLQEVITNT